MRKGFSLITAIVFMILVATLGALALSLSTTSVKQTSDLYLREQAEVLVQSATEYALLAISGHTRTTDCLNHIDTNFTNGTNGLFNINISLYYIGNGLAALNCNRFSDDNISTSESNLTVIIDTVVTSASGVSTEPIRLHRRTIQKP